MTISKEMADEVVSMANLIKTAADHGTKYARFATEANKRIDELLKELDDPSQNRAYPRAVTPPEGPANSMVQREPGGPMEQVPQRTQPSAPLGRVDEVTGEVATGGLSESRTAEDKDGEAQKAREDRSETQRLEEAKRRQDQVQRQVPEGHSAARPDPTPGQPQPHVRQPNQVGGFEGGPRREDLKREFEANRDKPDTPDINRRI